MAEVEVPADAQRVCGLDGGLKCRAESLKVLAIAQPSGTPVSKCAGMRDKKLIYKVGEVTMPDSFDPNPLASCAPGLHFFISKRDAEAYN